MAAGDGGPAPAGLFLPQSGAAHWHPLGAGNTAGQAWDAAPAAAAGHCYLSRAGLLRNGWGWKEWVGRGKDILAGKVTERLQEKGMRRKEIKEHLQCKCNEKSNLGICMLLKS